MKQSELLEAAKCAFCKKPFGHTGLPLFWRVKIQRYGVDMNAVRRQDGLSTFMGNTTIAAVMGPDEDMATLIDDGPTVTVCESCAMECMPLAEMVERIK